MVILALDPETVATETLKKMSQKPARALHRSAQQIFVFEPDRQGCERRVVPGLSVGEALVELADQIGGFLPEAADRLRRRPVQLIALAQQHCSGQVVGKPDRLEVGRKEQATRTEHVVPIGVLEIMLAVVSENSARAGYGPALAAQSGNRSELS